MSVVIFKALTALVSGLLGAWMLRTRVMELPERAFLRWAVGLHVVPALALFLGLYVLGHQEPTSDVPAYYLPAARAVLRGEVPFRDFMSSYAPLFPYVGAALVAAWNSGKVFALFAMTLNVVTLLLWHRCASARFDRRVTRCATVLYASSGHVFVQGLLGTNQPWIGVALAASALLITLDRPVAAGLVQAGAACATKVLAHLFWPVFWICAPQRSKWLLAAVLPTAAVYLVFVAVGAGPQLLHPLQYEGGRMSSGNLLYLLDLFLGVTGPSERLILDGLTATACAVTLGWLYLRTRAVPVRDRPALLPAALALAGLTLMLFSKKSFTGYVIFVMYPLVLLAAAGMRRRVAFLVLFNVLLVVEPSLWFHLDGFNRSLRTWIASGGGSVAAGFICLDLALLACYVYLAWLSVRWVQTTVDGAMAERNASQSTTACSLV
jgi:hypothetical protein